jgi:hypothetical protein
MLSKSEFLAALKRETKILTHLASKLEAKHLDFRFSPPQRSTLELLQYLTINLEAGTTYFVTGSWDHWEGMAERAKAVDLAGFAKALKKQESAVAKLLKPISDKAFTTKKVKPVSGKGSVVLSQALFEGTLTWAIGYRMQLFLQAKAAGLAGLNSGNLWAGKDSKKH